MKLQQLYSYVRQAIDDYQMIADGDRIAVGISGGKDSLTLLYALSGLRRFYPKKFELAALTVDLGFDHFDLSEIRQLCKTLDVEYHVKTGLFFRFHHRRCASQGVFESFYRQCFWYRFLQFRSGRKSRLLSVR